MHGRGKGERGCLFAGFVHALPAGLSPAGMRLCPDSWLIPGKTPTFAAPIKRSLYLNGLGSHA